VATAERPLSGNPAAAIAERPVAGNPVAATVERPMSGNPAAATAERPGNRVCYHCREKKNVTLLRFKSFPVLFLQT
jgi:hypothetical protein